MELEQKLERRRIKNGYRLTYLLKNPWVRNWINSKGNAHKKGWEHKLTVGDFKNLWLRDSAHLLKAPSIDRINPKNGYIKGNCRFIERSENCRLGGQSRSEAKIRASKINLKKAQLANSKQ